MSVFNDIIGLSPQLTYVNSILANVSTSFAEIFSLGSVPGHGIGGYIPFVDLPCEKYIGETIGWSFILGLFLPHTCKLIPWLCCPIPFEFNSTYTISSDINCDEAGAYYGASLYWTMQGVSIYGLVLSLLSLARCSVDFIDGNRNVSNVIPNLTWKAGVLTSVFDIQPNLTILGGRSLEQNIQEVIQKNVEFDGEYDPTRSIILEDDDYYSSKISRRSIRSAGFLRIPIPTLKPIYRGPGEKTDNCERDEIMHLDGECHQLLSQGPCEDTEVVLMDVDTKKGYCAPRLCNPDRVFVFGDQKCHDPYENDICPPGRILFTTSYGSPVCGCPYGTYEEEEDSDDEDVCQTILAKIETCPPGEVFWFRSFNVEPECLPDPCKGLNAQKGLDELPYVPSAFDGKCYQLGQELPQCPSDTFYTLSFSSLKGICASLEDAGFTVLDEDMLDSFARMYGSRLPRDASSTSRSRSKSSSSSSSVSKSSSGSLDNRISSSNSKDSSRRTSSMEEKSDKLSRSSVSKVSRPVIGSSVVPTIESKPNGLNLQVGQSVTGERLSESDDSRDSKKNPKMKPMVPTHVSAFSPSTISIQGSSAFANFFRQFLNPKESTEEPNDSEHSRRKRELLQFAAPETVFQSTFAACRAGDQFGVNFKCNTRYLPNRLPKARPKRNIPPLSPSPDCPQGSLYTITRKCVSNESRIRSNLIASGLG